MGRLEGKVALITGGARGQGAAEARLFAGEGAKVVVSDVLDDDGQAVASEIDGLYCHHDVTDPAAWDAAVRAAMERFGRIDILINNAGIGGGGGGLATSDFESYMRVIMVNQVGVFLGMKAVSEPMKDQGAGSIVNISSIAGMSGFNKRNAIGYTASKWAVRGMTKAAAQELGRFGVRVNSVHPGYIDTPMLRGIPPRNDDEQLAHFTRRAPLKRVGTADEVANLVLFLASDESSYCTGGEFVVDGGMIA